MLTMQHKAPSTKRGVHSLNRPSRCLLASASQPPFLLLPRIQAMEEEVCLQSNALRTEHSPKDIHEASRHNHPAATLRRSSSASISRQLAGVGSIHDYLSADSQKGDPVPGTPRLKDQPQEVSPFTRSEIQMFRNLMGLRVTPPLHSIQEEERDRGSCQETNPSQEDFKMPTGKSIGLSPVRSSDRPGAKSTSKRCVRILEKIRIKRSKRSTKVDPDPIAYAVKAVVNNQEPSTDNSSATTTTILGRIRRPFSREKSARELVAPVQNLSHQHFGSYSSFPDIEETISRRAILIRLVLDNEVILKCLNRQGSRSPHINHVILAIFYLARKKGWHLSAVHLQGFRNHDALSRRKPIETEWSLDADSFSFISVKVPVLQINLFATSDNKKLPRYVAPYMHLHLPVSINQSPAKSPRQAKILQRDSSSSGYQVAQK
ncbi:uncharacterized protein [Palaemon carinicauda]|uniref:uncharacterized protein n=1 Tax=Palaemon carinicauda TaxID=392227 RepID=UPI0035B5B153